MVAYHCTNGFISDFLVKRVVDICQMSVNESVSRTFQSTWAEYGATIRAWAHACAFMNRCIVVCDAGPPGALLLRQQPDPNGPEAHVPRPLHRPYLLRGFTPRSGTLPRMSSSSYLCVALSLSSLLWRPKNLYFPCDCTRWWLPWRLPSLIVSVTRCKTAKVVVKPFIIIVYRLISTSIILLLATVKHNS